MPDTAIETPTKVEEKTPTPPSTHDIYGPLATLRREVNRLFDDFGRGLWRFPFGRSAFEVEPFWRRGVSWAATPAVDVVERDNAYEITAELPGLGEKDVEVKVANGNLMIKGEKQEEKEKREKGYYLHERRFGAFERCFRMPEGVDAEKIEATFKKGVLTVTLPKTAEAQKKAKKIAIKVE
jgi:HSP20 family protein